MDETLVKGSSEYFQTALKPEWQPGKSRVIELPFDDAISFNVYLNWLYFEKIFVKFDGDYEVCSAAKSWQDLTNAYVLGDKLLDTPFKEAVMDAMVVFGSVRYSSTRVLPSINTISSLYDKTPTGSAARHFVTDLFTHAISKDLVTEEWSRSPAFVFDLYKAAIDKASKAPHLAAIDCAYHEHKEGKENCYRTKTVRTTRKVCLAQNTRLEMLNRE